LVFNGEHRLQVRFLQVLSEEKFMIIEWTRLLGTTSRDEANALTTGLDGSIYVAGITFGDLDGQTNSGAGDAFIAKYNPDGTKAWTRLLGTTSQDIAYALTTGVDGSIYVAGITGGNLDGRTNSGVYDAFITKYKPDGTREWTRLLGSPESDAANALTTGLDGSIYVAGITGGNLDGQTNLGGPDAFITKYNPDGIKAWTRLLGTVFSDYAHALTTGLDGSIYIAGYTLGNLDGQTNSGAGDAFITKYNPDGTKAWTRLLGTTSTDIANALTTGADGSIYISGYTSGNLDGQINSGNRDAFIAKYNPDGTKEWTRLLGTGTSDEANALITGADGSIYISGYTSGDLSGQPNNGGVDAFITKYKPDGTKEWTKLLGTSSNESANAMTTGVNGSIFIAGSTFGDLDGQTHSGNGDAFITKLIDEEINPTLSIAPLNAIQSEGNEELTPFTFTVTRTGNTGTSSANWAVTGTGTNPPNVADFGGTLPTGTVTFAAGETSQVITVNVSGDTVVEPEETFTVTLSNPSNATITTATATGTILNDDASLDIAPTNAIRLEGNTGTTPLTFTVTRTGNTTGISTANWAVTGTEFNPANAADFGGTLPTGTVTFAAGVTSQVITVNVQGDTVAEPEETFTVSLSNPSNATITTATAAGTILDDDLTNPPQLLITPESNKVTPGRGDITLNYRLDNFNDTQISFAGFSIYFDNSQLNINTGDVNLSSSAGTIVSKTIIDDTANADSDPNTDKELILTISPLESTNSDNLFLNIPFTTTAGFDGESTVNFAANSGNPNVDVLGVPSVTVSGLAADIDGNSRVTGADLLFISQYLLLRNNPNVDAILQSSFNLFSTETVGATNTTGAALRNAITNGVNRLAFDVDGNGQVTGGDIFLINQGLLLKNNPNVDAILQTSFNLFTSELTGPRNTGAEINAFISELLG
jgi:uncharacterized delta-60 repeat protein